MKSPSPPLSLNDYWHTVGTVIVLRVLAAARPPIDIKYARQIKTGLKKPGANTALALVEAARRITPGLEPDLELMLRPARVPTRSRRIEPSAAFVRSQKQRRD